MRQQDKPDEKVSFWEWIARVHMKLAVHLYQVWAAPLHRQECLYH